MTHCPELDTLIEEEPSFQLTPKTRPSEIEEKFYNYETLSDSGDSEFQDEAYEVDYDEQQIIDDWYADNDWCNEDFWEAHEARG